MTIDDAIALLERADLAGSEAEAWADLGCGEGTFTRALATLLPSASVIHAVDREARQLRAIPPTYAGTSIVTHAGDFTAKPWPFGRVDGVLLANALHYVRNQLAFLLDCADNMNVSPRFLIVEYDTDRANPWVPYPVSQRTLQRLFTAAGVYAVEVLATRPSIYQRAPIYSAIVRPARAPTTSRKRR